MAAERIELARVEFKEAMNVPGGYNAEGDVIYPTREKVVAAVIDASNRLRSRQKFHLWYDPVRAVVVVEHPESGIRECVPRENVVQWREVDARDVRHSVVVSSPKK